MWLDSCNERNAIRSGLAGPLEDVAALDHFWPAAPEASRRSAAPSALAMLIELFAASRMKQRLPRHRLTSFCNAEPLSRLS